MIDEDSEIACLYFGDEATEEEAQEIADAIEEKYDFLEVEVHRGGQPVYYYILSVE